MIYLSNLPSKTDCQFLFIQPYVESGMHFYKAVSEKNYIHFLVGLSLAIPIVNSLSISLFREIQFQSLSSKLLKNIYSIHLTPKKERIFKFEVSKLNEITIKFKDCSICFSKMMEYIKWNDLGAKWCNISEKQIENYLSISNVFKTQQGFSVFKENNPFIRLYTSHGFYAWLNPLLRSGTLNGGRLTYTKKEINEELTSKNPNAVDLIVSELFFLCLATTGELQSLKKTHTYSDPVVRMACIPKTTYTDMTSSKKFTERSFTSAAGLGGQFAGGGKPNDGNYVRVRYKIRSKSGISVQNASDLPENEVIFKPFSRFRIVSETGDDQSGYRIEAEELN